MLKNPGAAPEQLQLHPATGLLLPVKDHKLYRFMAEQFLFIEIRRSCSLIHPTDGSPNEIPLSRPPQRIEAAPDDDL
jgi:hypothetical protein